MALWLLQKLDIMNSDRLMLKFCDEIECMLQRSEVMRLKLVTLCYKEQT